MNNGLDEPPAEIKERTKIVIKRGVLEAIAAAVILASVFAFIGIKIQLTNLQKRINVAKMEFSSLGSQLNKAETEILASAILADEPQWEDVFMELSNLIPDNIYLTDIGMKSKSITIKGVVSAADGEQVLADFVITLENGIFNNTKLVSSKELPEKAGIEFELKAWVDYEA